MSMLSTRTLPTALATPPLNAAPEVRAGQPAPGASPSFANLIDAQLSGGSNAATERANPVTTSSPPPRPLQPQSQTPSPSAKGEPRNDSSASNDAGTARGRERIAERSAAARAAEQAAVSRHARGNTQQANTRDLKARTPEPDRAHEGDGTKDVKRQPSTDETTRSPLAEWLAALNPQAPEAGPTDVAAALAFDGTQAGADAEDEAVVALPGEPTGHADAGRRLGAAPRRTATDTETGGRAATGALQQLGRFELQTATDSPSHVAELMQQPTNHAAVESVNTVPVSATDAGLAAPGAAAAPAEVQLPTPISDPDFPDLFATQVSVLVKDGVQEARLHLNPAEMGPISVQIALDGTQAQVDFTAATGATRDLIETSLPMLAAALHDAGLTLSGGGVFQQARDPSTAQHDQAGGRGQTQRFGANSTDGAEAAQAPVRRISPRGMLDLYA